MPRKPLEFSAVRDIASKLPGVEQGFIHGAPSLKLGGKLLACPALHKSAEPDSLVVRIGIPERKKLISDEPDIYYVTPHYSKYPMVLVRLSHVDRASLRRLLRSAWTFGSAKKATKPKSREVGRRPSSR